MTSTAASASARPASSFLILHGWQNRRPKPHRQHRPADELTARGHAVTCPQLPEPDGPDRGTWLDRLHTLLGAEPEAGGPERVVICHSLAVLLWLHAAAGGGVRADRVLLVAPPSTEVIAGYQEVAGFAQLKVTGPQARAAAARTRLVAGDDDPYCPGGADLHYGRPLGLDTDTITGGAHLDLDAGYGPWPSVLAWCLDPAERIVAR
ncbi:RBBP9/YdeN family alpha/beta hydrolase [Streptomyces sp. NPDC096176]|uniref:RBBP9/YdeN family alpha/beta hydrolase n=1 Tax=Streptomyces sp. NPDC096176 TaxID=3366079 RepID=UPI00381B8FDE